MGLSLCLDRFEGPDKGLAVLADDEGRQLVVPRALLPLGAVPGSVFTCSFAYDVEATDRLADRAARLQAELRKTDPGGDIQL